MDDITDDQLRAAVEDLTSIVPKLLDKNDRLRQALTIREAIPAALLDRALDRFEADLQRTGQGNPNHKGEGPGGGQFTSSGGSGGHGKHRARRERRKRKLQAIRKRYKREAKDLKATHKHDRRELTSDHRKQWRDQHREHAKERKDHVKWEQGERKQQAKEHAVAHKDVDREHAAAQKRHEKGAAREHQEIDRQHAEKEKRITRGERKAKATDRRHEKERAKEEESLGRLDENLKKWHANELSAADRRGASEHEKTKIRERHSEENEKVKDQPELRRKRMAERHAAERQKAGELLEKSPKLRERLEKQTAAKHEHVEKRPERLEVKRQRMHGRLDKQQTRERKEQTKDHRQARAEVKTEHRENLKSLQEDHRADRESTRESQREDRQELVERLKDELAEHGFRRKSGQAESRFLDDDLAIERASHGGNPHHKGKGPGGGQFAAADGGGGGGSDQSHSHGQHATKREKREKRKKRPVRKSGQKAAGASSATPKTTKPAKTTGASNAKPKAKAIKPAKSDREKAKPIRGEMAAAKREGKGKDAKIVMADGSTPPSHVDPNIIPPAWTDVHVSVDPKAEVLAVGRDVKGRPKMVTTKSYDARSAVVKYGRVSEMIGKHDQITKEIQEARSKPETREEADAAWLMQTQGTRPGSNADTKAKVKAYGATTLEARHVVKAPDGVRLQFIGKEGIYHDHLMRDEKLGKMLIERKNATKAPHEPIFKTDEKKVRSFVNGLDGGGFSSKDFRTSLATRMATKAVESNPIPSKDQKEHTARVKKVAEHVSSVLGNKPAQALESYIHPAVFASWSPKS